MVASKQTRLKLKKGFHNAPISYKVLMVNQFNAVDLKEIAKGLAHAISPVKAKELLPQPGKRSVWSMRQISLVGNFDVQSLHYKGLEVAVFWRRQLSEVTPDPSDPVPEGVIEHPDDVWVRLDLIGKSARQLMQLMQSEFNEKNRLQVEVDSLIRINEAHETTIKALQSEIKALKTKPKRK
jgi:hypothetical protein